jgi:hypothetical protein
MVANFAGLNHFSFFSIRILESVAAFEQAFHSVRRGDRIVAVTLPNDKMTVLCGQVVLNFVEK